MDVFVEKLKDIRERNKPFCGCTLYGSGRNRIRPGFSSQAPCLPFPPEAAEGPFQRLKEGGVSCIRLVIAWETLEHAGPGIYDESCLAYLRKILVIAAQKGIVVFINPVQNRWSTWVSGEGAPPWAGEQRHKGQDWLQDRYFDCMRHCFRRLKNCTAFIGWGAWAEDLSRPFIFRFAGRMREAREGMLFFIAENSRKEEAQQRRLGTGEDPKWAVGAFCYYDDLAFPDYQGDLAISVPC
jgi:hypothetical protein